MLTIKITKVVNYHNQIVGDNNVIDNTNIQTTSESFSFVGKINFTSRTGKSIYAILISLLLLFWTLCICCLTPISYIIAMTLIPALFFILGKQYLKQNQDESHLKIHKILMLMIVFAIVMFCVVSIFLPLIGTTAVIIGCILMAFDLMACLALCLNAFGGAKHRIS